MIELFFYAAFVFLTAPILLAKNWLVGIFYSALFLYSGPSLFGYFFLPYLSARLGAYYGPDIGYVALHDCFATLFILFLINNYLYRRSSNLKPMWNMGAPLSVRGFGTTVLWVLLGVTLTLAVVNFDGLRWNSYIAGRATAGSLVALQLLYKWGPGIITGGYCIWREGFAKKDPFYRLGMVLYFLVFLGISVKAGDRTDVAALTVGLTSYEILSGNLKPRRILIALAAILVSISAMRAIELYRYDTAVSYRSLAETLLWGDYFAPVHILISAIALHYVHPLILLQSDASNSLMFLNYPYLQQPIMDHFRPGIATRAQSYAFYILTEGWVAVGPFGFLYSGLSISFGLWWWNRLSLTTDRQVSIILRSIFCCMAINLVRGQGSYFVKYLYTFCLPSTLMLIYTLGLRLPFPTRSISRYEPRVLVEEAGA